MPCLTLPPGHTDFPRGRNLQHDCCLLKGYEETVYFLQCQTPLPGPGGIVVWWRESLVPKSSLAAF